MSNEKFFTKIISSPSARFLQEGVGKAYHFLFTSGQAPYRDGRLKYGSGLDYGIKDAPEWLDYTSWGAPLAEYLLRKISPLVYVLGDQRKDGDTGYSIVVELKGFISSATIIGSVSVGKDHVDRRNYRLDGKIFCDNPPKMVLKWNCYLVRNQWLSEEEILAKRAELERIPLE